MGAQCVMGHQLLGDLPRQRLIDAALDVDFGKLIELERGVVAQFLALARKVLAGLPEPTRAGTSNNFDSLPRRQDYNDKVDIKVDQQFSPATSAFVRFSHRKVNNFEPPAIPGEIFQYR